MPLRFFPDSWRNPHLARLLAATGISEFGTEVSNLAMPLTAITVLHASIFEVAALTACMFFPSAAFGLFAGAWVDRARKRPLMIASDVIRAASLASIPLAWAFGALTLVQLYVVTLVVATLNILFVVAKQS
jgi:MFS family permease